MDQNTISQMYIEEVLRNIIPELDGSSIEAVTSSSISEAKIDNLKIYVRPSFIEHPKSRFHYDLNQPIIHFTNLHTLVSIMNEKAFRVYQIDSTSDIKEVERISSKFDIDEWDIKFFKERLFFGSFCSKGILNTEDELLFWRLYGNNTNGVALEFELNMEGAMSENFKIGQVSYEEPTNISRFRELHKQFMKKHGISNLDVRDILNTFSSFHKSSSFKYEKEVRIIHFNESGNYEDCHQYYGVDYRRGKLHYYYKIPLVEPLDKPLLKLEKIYLGPSVSQASLNKFKNEFLYAWNKRGLKGIPEVLKSEIEEQLI